LIVGLGYEARTGKDSVADHLVRRHRFVKRSFATSLKGACREIFHLTPAQLDGSDKEKPDPFWRKSPRHILQHFGTDVLRQHLHSSIWVWSLHRWLELNPQHKRVVIPDVRFANEVAFITDRGGILVRCVCLDGPKLEGAAAAHASENALASYEWPHTIGAKFGELPKLYERMDHILAYHNLL
jgi:hypothetical protein